MRAKFAVGMVALALVLAITSTQGAQMTVNTGEVTFDPDEITTVMAALREFAKQRTEYQEQVDGIIAALRGSPTMDRRSNALALMALSWDSRNPASCEILKKITPKAICMK